MIEPSIAHQKLETTNPLMSDDTSINIKALITKRNIPRVNIVTGRVTRIKNGLTSLLTKAKTMAVTTAVQKFSTLIPGKNQQVKYIITE